MHLPDDHPQMGRRLRACRNSVISRLRGASVVGGAVGSAESADRRAAPATTYRNALGRVAGDRQRRSQSPGFAFPQRRSSVRRPLAPRRSRSATAVGGAGGEFRMVAYRGASAAPREAGPPAEADKRDRNRARRASSSYPSHVCSGAKERWRRRFERQAQHRSGRRAGPLRADGPDAAEWRSSDSPAVLSP